MASCAAAPQGMSCSVYGRCTGNGRADARCGVCSTAWRHSLRRGTLLPRERQWGVALLNNQPAALRLGRLQRAMSARLGPRVLECMLMLSSFVHTHACMHACTCVCMCARTHACMGSRRAHRLQLQRAHGACHCVPEAAVVAPKLRPHGRRLQARDRSVAVAGGALVTARHRTRLAQPLAVAVRGRCTTATAATAATAAASGLAAYVSFIHDCKRAAGAAASADAAAQAARQATCSLRRRAPQTHARCRGRRRHWQRRRSTRSSGRGCHRRALQPLRVHNSHARAHAARAAGAADAHGVAAVAQEAGAIAEEARAVLKEAGAVAEEAGAVADEAAAPHRRRLAAQHRSAQV
mmetsp:Transcript_21275/g.63783  ORF Transcript_21275/g.63783 Transcript_21275/m.63783 type:complete len:351 (+) Transcript_21275:1976-3028(+)